MSRRKTMLKRAIMVALGAVLALAVAMPVAFGQVGQGSVASGMAEKLAADWWSWAVSTPEAENPLMGEYTDNPNHPYLAYEPEKCDGQPVTDVRGKKWFLAGSAGDTSGGLNPEAAERSCTVPKGTQLFFPVVNTVVSDPVDGAEEDLPQIADALIDDALEDGSWYVRVDGKNVKAKRIFRVQSAPFALDYHPQNPLAPFGYTGSLPSVSDGLWVTLPPLSKGLHTIEFGGDFYIDMYDYAFPLDIVYHVRVK
jgi:hypothetical protein